MAPRRPRRKILEDEYTHLSIRVERYEARMEAAINRDAFYPQYAFNLDDRDPVYRFVTDLTITGTAFDPQERAGEIYEFDIYGDDVPSRSLHATLEDVHTRDESGARCYRAYRGQSIPVYAPPGGVGILHKVRGERRWTAYVNVLPRFLTSMLMLLGTGRDLYVALHERKDGRVRWLQSLSLQTTDPAED